MKRYKSVLIVCIMLLSMTRCNDDILYVENKNRLSSEDFYKTAVDYELAINSCYTILMDRGMFGLYMHLNQQTWSDHVLFESTPRDMMTHTAGSGEIRTTWMILYAGIYRTSRLIEQLNKNDWQNIPDMTQDNHTYYLAESKALRAMFYFYLVTFFNQPPFYNEDNIPDDILAEYPNGDQLEFWEQIETDITEANPGLKFKSEMPSTEYGRPTKGGAKALLAKSLLYKHYHYYCQRNLKNSADDIADLNQAKSLIGEIIASNEYSLVQVKEPKTKNDYLYALLSNTAFTDLITPGGNTYKSENNEESLWEVQFADGPAKNDNYYLPGWLCPGEMSFLYFSPHQSSYKNQEANPDFYNEFEVIGAPVGFDRDPRCYATFYMNGDTMDFREESPYYKKFSPLIHTKRAAFIRKLPLPDGVQYGLGIKKHFFPVFYEGIYQPANSPSNKRVIRYADVLLLYAEIDFLLGNTTGDGLNALNQVRARVGMPPVAALTSNAIIHERDVELAFEFSRLSDIIRWSMDEQWNIQFDQLNWGIDATNSVIPFVKGRHEYLPIPLREIDIMNGELKQNPGW